MELIFCKDLQAGRAGRRRAAAAVELASRHFRHEILRQIDAEQNQSTTITEIIRVSFSINSNILTGMITLGSLSKSSGNRE